MERNRKCELLATLSSCCGVLGETALTDGALVILFAGALGASAKLSLLTTSVLPLVNGLCIMPMALVAMKIGHVRLILISCFLACLAFFAAVCSPFFGSWAANVLVGSIFAFSLSLSGFVAGWFPMLDTFLVPERRTAFFSRMRFWHQMSATAFMYVISLFIGKESSMEALQLAMLAAAVIFIGRGVAIAFIKVERHGVARTVQTGGLRTAFANKSLRFFSIYLFLVNFSTYCFVPVTTLYLKNSLGAPDNVIVRCGTAALCGMLMGYLTVLRILKFLSPRNALAMCHAAFIALGLAIAFVPANFEWRFAAIGALMLLFAFTIATVAIISSAEMMRLASASNKVMDLAFCGMLNYGGYGLSRLVASWLLGVGSVLQASCTTSFLNPYRFVYFVCLVLLICSTPMLFGLGRKE